MVGCLCPEFSMDGSRTPSTMGSVREHEVGAVMNKDSGMTAAFRPKVPFR